MWEKIKQHFIDFPAQQQVALTMLKQGLRVSDDGNIFCGNIEISSAKFARAIGVDRRAINSTAKTIVKVPELHGIFSRLKPTADLSDVAKNFSFGVIEIKAEARTIGIMAKITSMIANAGISVRQIIADDPYMVPEPKAIIITETQLPGDLVNEFLRIEGVKEVTVK